MYPLRNSDIKSTLLPDGYMVLFNTKTDWVHTLNPCGALVWEFCDGTQLPDQIAAEVAAIVLPEQPQALKAEVRELIHQLAAQGVLIDAQPGDVA